MNDPNKKGQGQVAKRNPEEDVTHLFLEASLNIGVFNLSIPENQQVKNKPIDGPRNKVFLTKSAPYKFYLGNFSLDKLEKDKSRENYPQQGADKNINPHKDSNIDSYTVTIGYVNWKNTWDLPDKDAMDSFSPEINPLKNKSNAFRYMISTNDKTGSFKEVKFDIIVKRKCWVCEKEEPDVRLVYCQNDRQYFCTICDKTRHEQKEKMSLNLHLRTTNFKYTLTYFGNCHLPGHLNKPYQYFDEKNKSCLCVKCVEQLLNIPDKIETDIHFIEDYLKAKNNDEDFLNSRIEAVCEEIDNRLFYATDVWKKIDKYEKDYYQVLDDDKKINKKKMYEEGYARQTFLCCIFMEIQRILKEIDSKIIFIKNQRNNVDVSTFLYMNQIYQLYMKNELIANLEYLCNSPLELSTKPIITLLDKDAKKIEPLKLEPFIDINKDDYILNDN